MFLNCFAVLSSSTSIFLVFVFETPIIRMLGRLAWSSSLCHFISFLFFNLPVLLFRRFSQLYLPFLNNVFISNIVYLVSKSSLLCSLNVSFIYLFIFSIFLFLLFLWKYLRVCVCTCACNFFLSLWLLFSITCLCFSWLLYFIIVMCLKCLFIFDHQLVL